MPAKVAKKGDKFRVVDPDGKIAKNSAGTAADGGGHSRKEDAERQARAINRSLSKKGKI